MAFFQRPERSRIDKDADNALRSRDERFLAGCAARKDTHVRRVFE
jgi:hypothetical protein